MAIHPVTIEPVPGHAAFLEVAGRFLARDPVVNTVVATTAQRLAAEQERGLRIEGIERQWWAVVRDGAQAVISAAMRTAPTPPYPPYLLPMPDEAARALALELLARGEEVAGVNGALPAVHVFARTIAAETGARVQVAMHTRLFVLGTLVPPVSVPGRLRPATEEDLDLATGWFREFSHDVEVQGRREAPSERTAVTEVERELMRRTIGAGRLWFWEADGRTVHMTGANPPSFGVARIGPVFTPAEHRRRGYAGAAVAAVAAHYLAQGTQVCLFTDQANPTSNGVYRAIGFRPVVDMANLVLTVAAPRV